ADPLAIAASIALLLLCEFLDDAVQRVETFVPALAIPLEPRGLLLHPQRTQPARSHTSDLSRADEAGLLQDADVLLHACQRHVEPARELRDRSVGAAELLQHASARRVRERRERGIE